MEGKKEEVEARSKGKNRMVRERRRNRCKGDMNRWRKARTQRRQWRGRRRREREIGMAGKIITQGWRLG
jgi:hypothetical protein